MSAKKNDSKKEQKKDAAVEAAVDTNALRIAELEQELTAIKDERDLFRKFYVAETLKKMPEDMSYMADSFSKIDPEKVKELRVKYMPEKEIKEFEEVLKCSESTLDKVTLFNEWNAIFSESGKPYYYELEKDLHAAIEPGMKDLSVTQQGDTAALFEMAQLYPTGIKRFQTRIQSVRSQLAREICTDQETIESTIPILNDYLKSNKTGIEFDYETRYSKIPWLKVRFEKWIEALRKDFMSEETIKMEDEILNLTTEPPVEEPQPEPEPAPTEQETEQEQTEVAPDENRTAEPETTPEQVPESEPENDPNNEN